MAVIKLDDLRGLRQEAEELRDDMRTNGLTAGTLESEGFLRCAIAVCNTIEHVEKSFQNE